MVHILYYEILIYQKTTDEGTVLYTLFVNSV